MFDGPNIVSIAALIGDQTRASMLLALMSGEALTATELATTANISKQTASSHLGKLVDAGLIDLKAQGRHKYFALAAPDVAELLEKLLGVADRTGARRLIPGPREPALRKARICYDHLAGELGVHAYDVLLKKAHVVEKRCKTTGNYLLDLTESGVAFFQTLGLTNLTTGPVGSDTQQRISGTRRPACRACLDWSVRRHHLAGATGAMLLHHCFDQKWARRQNGTRIVKFSAQGETAFKKLFDAA